MINLTIHTQPDDESCGPTSLHAIYKYYGLNLDLHDLIQQVERSHSGGTLAPMLGTHALNHGFNTTIYVNNLNIFDPSWFEQGEAEPDELYAKLRKQLRYKHTKDIVQSSQAYQRFIKAGGNVRFKTFSVQLLKDYFEKKIPILTGLSATYLYRSKRERYVNGEAIYDDIRGTPCGHFVILCGYDDSKRHIVVADPHRENPLSHDNYYKVSSNHLLNAIMLGVFTYDANLIIIEPKDAECKPSL